MKQRLFHTKRYNQDFANRKQLGFRVQQFNKQLSLRTSDVQRFLGNIQLISIQVQFNMIINLSFFLVVSSWS